MKQQFFFVVPLKYRKIARAVDFFWCQCTFVTRVRDQHSAHSDNRFPSVGSIIQLADGCMKPVEELVTEDFIQSASRDKHVAIDMSTFVKVEPQPDSDSDRDVDLTFSVGKEKLRVRSLYNLNQTDHQF